MSSAKQRMILVSNRLPITISGNDGNLKVEPSSGGLVTALRPLLLDSAGVWVGWAGTEKSEEIERLLQEHSTRRTLLWRRCSCLQKSDCAFITASRMRSSGRYFMTCSHGATSIRPIGRFTNRLTSDLRTK